VETLSLTVLLDVCQTHPVPLSPLPPGAALICRAAMTVGPNNVDSEA
jgi:hypothetical protein